MLLVSECVARAALMRTESRGGHPRDDHPQMDSHWRNKLLVCAARGGRSGVARKPHESLHPDLLAAFPLAELESYFTNTELTGHPNGSTTSHTTALSDPQLT